MPVYTYRCKECGTEFDVQLGFNDPKPEVCPKCGARALRRVYKPVGIIFKGSGFYATDHRSSSGNGAGKHSERTKSEGGDKNAKTASSSEAKSSSAEKSSAKATANKPAA